MNIQEVYQALNLKEHAPNEEKLQALTTWYKNHISKDLLLDETSPTALATLEAMINFYHKEFAAHPERDLSEGVQTLDGKTPLEFAAFAGFHYFIENRTPTAEQVNQGNQFAMTPLHIAAAEGNVTTAQLLIKLGAKTNALNARHETPALCALRVPVIHADLLKERKSELFKMLSKKKPESLALASESGDTAAHLVAAFGFPELVNVIRQQASDLFNKPNHSGKYPTHTAILNGRIETLKKLLDIPGTKVLLDSKDKNILHYAAQYGDLAMTQLCASQGLDINAIDASGQTPLILAVLYNQPDVIAYLLEQGANIHAQDIQSRSILDMAEEEGVSSQVIDLLKASGAQSSNTVRPSS